MGIFEFVGGVWAALIIGVFFIAMIVGCTFDRHYNESPKWYIAAVAAITFVIWTWDSTRTFTDYWTLVISATIWKPLGIYLGMGVLYSALEFFMEIRRAEKYWSKTWASYKTSYREMIIKAAAFRATAPEPEVLPDPSLLSQVSDRITGNRKTRSSNDVSQTDEEIAQNIVNDFLKRHTQENFYDKRIIGIAQTEDRKGVEPKVNRQQLAEAVGCWTIFWPFYFISMIVGDLFTELFRIVADILASLSGRFVKAMFRDTFKLN